MEDKNDLDGKILLLKNHPSADEINSIINSILKESSDLTTTFRLITTLLNYTIPETYNLLPETSKNNIRDVFCSITGLGNLFSKITLIKDKSRESDARVLLRTLIQILTECFDTNLVSKLMLKNPSKPEIKEIDKLLFKGKCFSIVTEVATTCDIQLESKTFELSDNYVGYMNIQILSLFKKQADMDTINLFINSLASFNSKSSAQYFDLMFNEQNWMYAVDAFELLKNFEKKRFLLRLLTEFINIKYLTQKSNEKLVWLGRILYPLFDGDLVDEIFLDKIIHATNYNLNSLMALILSHLSKEVFHLLVIQLLKTWADENSMKSESIFRQEYRTHLLIQFLAQFKNTAFIKSILSNPIFLNAISNRLNSFSNNVKSLGVILADKVCEFGGQDKIFQLDNIEGYDFLINNDSTIIDVGSTTLEEAWDHLNEPEVIEALTEEEKNPSDFMVAFKKTSISTKDSDDESDFESDEEDDPTVTQRSYVSKPIYIKDILEYLNVDSKQPKSYEKRRIALTSAPTLIRQKSGFGNELTFYAEDLITNLIGLTNYYDEDDFEDLRLNCLIAVVAANSNCTFHLFRLLLTGDYSLKQRMCILSAASLAARELKGFEDEVVTKSYRNMPFASKTLPGHLHEQFLSLEMKDQKLLENERINPIYESVQREIMNEAAEDAHNQMHGGKILRLSSNLKKKQKQVSLVPKTNNFSKIIGSHFYFPLVSIWHEIGEIDIGHYSPILTAHYIKTLALLLHAAYPSGLNLNDMIKEFFLIITPLIQRVKLDEMQVIESIVTGILLICDIMDELHLIMHYHDNIAVIQKWLSLTWEVLIDEKIKSLCAGLLLRLNELVEKFERVLMDQMNGIY